MFRKANMAYEAYMGDVIKTPADFAVYGALCFYAGEERFCSPSVRELSAMLKASLGTVSKSLKALCAAGVIRKVERVVDGSAKAGRPKVSYEVLEGLNCGGYDSQAEQNQPQRINEKCDAEGFVAGAEQISESCNFSRSVAELYNAKLPELPSCIGLDGKMGRELLLRVKEDGARAKLSWWSDYFAEVRKRPWLMGNNPASWKADLRFLLRRDKMQDILCGDRYYGRWRRTKEQLDLDEFVNELGRATISGWKELNDGDDGDSPVLRAV